MRRRPALLLVLAFPSANALALDRKHRDASVEVAPGKAALEFAARYERAINTKSTEEFVAPVHVDALRSVSDPPSDATR